jgi:hypothetical protein
MAKLIGDQTECFPSDFSDHTSAETSLPQRNLHTSASLPLPPTTRKVMAMAELVAVSLVGKTQ